MKQNKSQWHILVGTCVAGAITGATLFSCIEQNQSSHDTAKKVITLTDQSSIKQKDERSGKKQSSTAVAPSHSQTTQSKPPFTTSRLSTINRTPQSSEPSTTSQRTTTTQPVLSDLRENTQEVIHISKETVHRPYTQGTPEFKVTFAPDYVACDIPRKFYIELELPHKNFKKFTVDLTKLS